MDSLEPQWPVKLPISSSRAATKLPFPLVSGSAHERPTSIPEENEILSSPDAVAPPEASKSPLPPSSSPVKSSLKQPSGSRIPRIGAKPYSRLRMSPKRQESKSPTISRKANADSATGSGTVRILLYCTHLILLSLTCFFDADYEVGSGSQIWEWK